LGTNQSWDAETMNYSISLVRSSTKFIVILTPIFSDVAIMALGLKSRVPKKKLVLSIKYYKYQIVHASR
jgi:hypothetical protein